jgi:hypothetical protein
MTQKVLMKVDTKLLKNRSRIQKTRTWVSEDFLGPIVTTLPKFWGSAEISASLSVFLKILSCGIFSKNSCSDCLLLFFPIVFQKLSESKGQ